MMHHLAHYNWAGILFTLLILPASGMMTVGLRCWSQRIEQKKRDRRNVMPWRDYWHMLRLGIGWSRRNLRPVEAEPVVWARRSTDRATSGATVVPHEHVFDLMRSRMVDVAPGFVRVQCAVQGCAAAHTFPDTVVLGWK